MNRAPPACFAVEPLNWHCGREGIVEIGAADMYTAIAEQVEHHRRAQHDGPLRLLDGFRSR